MGTGRCASSVEAQEPFWAHAATSGGSATTTVGSALRSRAGSWLGFLSALPQMNDPLHPNLRTLERLLLSEKRNAT